MRISVDLLDNINKHSITTDDDHSHAFTTWLHTCSFLRAQTLLHRNAGILAQYHRLRLTCAFYTGGMTMSVGDTYLPLHVSSFCFLHHLLT